MNVHELWGKRIRKVKRRVKTWMIQHKENEECEVYDDLRTFKRHYLRPTIQMYNELNHQEFVRNSDIIALNIKTEQLVLAYNKLAFDYSGPPAADPNQMVSSLVDLNIVNNYQ